MESSQMPVKSNHGKYLNYSFKCQNEAVTWLITDLEFQKHCRIHFKNSRYDLELLEFQLIQKRKWPTNIIKVIVY